MFSYLFSLMKIGDVIFSLFISYGKYQES